VASGEHRSTLLPSRAGGPRTAWTPPLGTRLAQQARMRPPPPPQHVHAQCKNQPTMGNRACGQGGQRRTAEHAEEQHPRAPHVARLVVAGACTLADLADNDLGRYEGGRATHSAHNVAVEIDDLAEAEVGELDRRVISWRCVQNLHTRRKGEQLGYTQVPMSLGRWGQQTFSGFISR
jgi:hypothetical protein